MEGAPALYRQRNPKASPLYRLVAEHYEELEENMRLKEATHKQLRSRRHSGLWCQLCALLQCLYHAFPLRTSTGVL
jgi:hypothetical protein